MWDKRIQAKGKVRESSQKSQSQRQRQRILEYLHIQKPKSLELMNIKIFKKWTILYFLPNNILTRLFKELKKKYIYIYIRMTINNI